MTHLRKAAGALAVLVFLGIVGPSGARADFVYQVDSYPAGLFEVFNNSFSTADTEDNWVANSFQVVAGATRLTSISFRVGLNVPTNEPITAAIYLGSSLFDPNAAGGLVRISTTTTTVPPSSGGFATIDLASPVDLNVGQIFYAALLIRGVSPNVLPFVSDFNFTPNPPPPLGRSFFDVGPMIGPRQGGSYNLDDTHNATVLGGSHPVVDGAQDPGNLVLRVNAEETPVVPESSSFLLAGFGTIILVGYGWKRKS